MSVIQLFPIRTFTFTNVQGGLSLTIPVIRALDVSRWREGTLIVRIHSKDVPSGGTIDVTLTTTSLSEDDPSSTFNAASAAATVSVTSSLPATVPGLITAALSANFGSMLTLKVTGTQPAVATTHTAVLSAELSVKA